MRTENSTYRTQTEITEAKVINQNPST